VSSVITSRVANIFCALITDIKY